VSQWFARWLTTAAAAELSAGFRGAPQVREQVGERKTANNPTSTIASRPTTNAKRTTRIASACDAAAIHESCRPTSHFMWRPASTEREHDHPMTSTVQRQVV
jgi:hypothetical protein